MVVHRSPDQLQATLGSRSWGLEQAGNLAIAGFSSVRGERLSMRIRRIDEWRMPCEQAARPLCIASLSGVEQVLDLDRQQSAELAQTVNGPPGRSRIEAMVARVQLGPAVTEEGDERSMPVKRRVMQRGRPLGVASTSKLGVRREEHAYPFNIARFHGLEEARDLAHVFWRDAGR
jgi:hypothetical protein